MFETDPINITFRIPAQDHLGREEVVGKLRFLHDHVELNWRLKGNVFRGGKEAMKKIEMPYSEIEHVELIKSWFKYRKLELHVGDPEIVGNIPGVDMGKMVLEIDERSREEAKRLVPMIDFKRSVFLVDEQAKHLDRLREEL